MSASVEPREPALPPTLSLPVLVLDRTFRPVRMATVREAFSLLYCGRARALDRQCQPHDFCAWARSGGTEMDDCLGTPSGCLGVPRILLLPVRARVLRAPSRPARRDIFVRDDHTCQYCGQRPPRTELNLDHVLPRSRGGPWSWTNLVTSCRRCNLRKACRTPDECGMPLLRPPRRPRLGAALWLHASPHWFREWSPFLPAQTCV